MYALAILIILLCFLFLCNSSKPCAEHMRGTYPVKGHPRLIRSRYRQHADLYWPKSRAYFPQYHTQYEENMLKCLEICSIKNNGEFENCAKLCKDLYSPNLIVI